MPEQETWQERANEWLASATEDFRLVQLGAANEAVAENILGFHAQQAIEKTLKALLLAKTVVPPRTHDLRFLADRVHALYGLAVDPLAGHDLTPWATVHRYSDTTPHAEPLDRAAVLKQVESCLGLANRLLRRRKS